jgi:hypothetical protein
MSILVVFITKTISNKIDTIKRSLTWEANIQKLLETYEEWVKEHQKLHH